MSHHDSACCCCCKTKEIAERFVKFDVAGVYEWKVPRSAWYKVTVTGAGGAGGSAMITAAPAAGWICNVGGAGGAGGTAQKRVYLLKGDKISVTVGRGGRNSRQLPAAKQIVAEEAGESSFFGNHCSATGGKGGETQPNSFSVARRTGDGGVGSNGDLNISGGKAIASCNYILAANLELQFYSPGCSPSIYGGTGYRSFVSSHGENGLYGAGGEGAIAQLYSHAVSDKDLNMVNQPFYGGNGGDGVVFIEWLEMQC